jgi:hypothetical protein
VRWLRRRHEEQAAAGQLEAAEREVELSRQRLRDAHEKVIRPLQGYADRNNFAGIIAASLAQGHQKGPA